MKTHEPVQAFAPANISCVFKIHHDTNPRWSGSMGFGFTINEGVTVQVTRADKTSITFNKESISLPTVQQIITALTTEKIAVQITSSLPLGAGFGLSGACGLATAYALNKLLDLKHSNNDLAIITHVAEVTNHTGLGDVTNQYFGGMVVKFQPSSQFIVQTIPFVNCPVYCKYISKLPTKSVLTNPALTRTINEAAEHALDKIKTLMEQNKPIAFADILIIAKAFSVTSGLLTDQETKKTIEAIEKKGGHAAMIMLGNAVMSDIPFEASTKYTISAISAHLLTLNA